MSTPATEAEAQRLRPYIPVATLREITRITREENEECDRRHRETARIRAQIDAIKQNMVRERRELKALEAQKQKLYAEPLYPRTDAARDAAWRAAAESRAAALEIGLTPLTETPAETAARVEGIAS